MVDTPPASFSKSLQSCTDSSDSRLANLEAWSYSELASANITNNMSLLWTNMVKRTPNFTYINMTHDDTNNGGFKKQILATSGSGSKELPFICESDSWKGVLDLDMFEVRVSSTFQPPTTFGLMEHSSKYLALGSVFSTGMFYGKGWCAQSVNISSQFIEVHFHRKDVLVTGIVIQDGSIQESVYGIERFKIEYRRSGHWKEMAPLDVPVLSETIWLKNALVTDALRVHPLKAKNVPNSLFAVFCLRLQLRGKFLLHLEDRKKQPKQQLVTT